VETIVFNVRFFSTEIQSAMLQADWIIGRILEDMKNSADYFAVLEAVMTVVAAEI
jgi:hypothetical protein